MLDANEPLTVPGAEVLAWVDAAGPDAVWVLPTRPRIATAQDGLPDVSLLLYRRGSTPTPDGGQLTLTVDLRLTDAERAAAAKAADALRPQPQSRQDPPLPPVEVHTPSWVDGVVHASIADGVTAEGKPSLLADNSCLLTVQLDAGQAAAVQDAWEHGFPDGTIELVGGVDGVSSASASGTVSSSSYTSSSSSSYTSSSSSSYTSGTSSSPTSSKSSTGASCSSGDPTTGGPTAGGSTAGGPTSGDPTSGGPTTGGPITGGSTTGGPTSGGPTTGTTSSRTVTSASVAASARQTVRVPLELRGPLRLPYDAKTARRTDLNL
jgi:hypothetical protein